MTREVILMSDVEGLGVEGDVVHVAEGYARNYLLPRKLAAPVNQATQRRIEKLRAERQARLEQERAGAEALAKQLSKASCTLVVKTGEEGKLYGSVTSVDILAVLAEQGIELQKKQLELEEPIRDLGVFEIPIKLHPELRATLKVWVVEE